MAAPSYKVTVRHHVRECETCGTRWPTDLRADRCPLDHGPACGTPGDSKAAGVPSHHKGRCGGALGLVDVTAVLVVVADSRDDLLDRPEIIDVADD